VSHHTIDAHEQGTLIRSARNHLRQRIASLLQQSSSCIEVVLTLLDRSFKLRWQRRFNSGVSLNYQASMQTAHGHHTRTNLGVRDRGVRQPHLSSAGDIDLQLREQTRWARGGVVGIVTL
jgi:hypothetical protein